MNSSQSISAWKITRCHSGFRGNRETLRHLFRCSARKLAPLSLNPGCGKAFDPSEMLRTFPAFWRPPGPGEALRVSVLLYLLIRRAWVHLSQYVFPLRVANLAQGRFLKAPGSVSFPSCSGCVLASVHPGWGLVNRPGHSDSAIRSGSVLRASQMCVANAFSSHLVGFQRDI